jgi:hypothetical protein
VLPSESARSATKLCIPLCARDQSTVLNISGARDNKEQLVPVPCKLCVSQPQWPLQETVSVKDVVYIESGHLPRIVATMTSCMCAIMTLQPWIPSDPQSTHTARPAQRGGTAVLLHAADTERAEGTPLGQGAWLETTAQYLYIDISLRAHGLV